MAGSESRRANHYTTRRCCFVLGFCCCCCFGVVVFFGGGGVGLNAPKTSDYWDNLASKREKKTVGKGMGGGGGGELMLDARLQSAIASKGRELVG